MLNYSAPNGARQGLPTKELKPAKVIKRFQSSQGGIIEIFQFGLEFGPPKYSAFWIVDFSTKNQIGTDTYSLGRLITEIEEAGHDLVESCPLDEYTLYARVEEGRIQAVDTKQSTDYPFPVSAFAVPSGVKLTVAAIDFFVLWKGPLSVNIASGTLYPYPPTTAPEALIGAVCAHYRIDRQTLVSKKRGQLEAEPRHIAMYLLREDADLSLKQVGLLLGKRDHSTVIHGVGKISRRLVNDPKIAESIQDIRTLASNSTFGRNGLTVS